MHATAKPACVLLSTVLLWGGLPAAAGAHVRRHVHHHASVRSQTGIASYYASTLDGRKTASGARFSRDRLTAASKTLPLGTRAEVTNLKNGRSVAVTVTDRGPAVKRRILDVSSRAADRLGMKAKGVAPVKVKPISTPGAPR